LDSSEWDERYASSELVWSAGPNRFLPAEVAGSAPGRALDLACGEGRNAIWLASEGWSVTGVDFSGVALDKARRIAHDRGVDVDWVLADVRTYEPQARTYDLVILFYLQLPGPELAAVLRHAEQAVAPQGTLLVVGHDSTNLTEGYGGPKDPAVLYGPDDVTSALTSVEVERAERVRRPVDTDDGTVEAIDVLVRALRSADGSDQPVKAR
jgi:SAM-dependent methyltransferase